VTKRGQERESSSAKCHPIGDRIRNIRSFPDLTPALLVDLDVELLRRRLDPLPGRISFLISDILDLIEARDRIPNMTRVLQRFLPLLGEGKGLFIEFLAILGAKLRHLRLHMPVSG